MVQVRFYHLQQQSQAQVLPIILTKALGRGHRVVVKLVDAQDVERMNEYLWSYKPHSFLPHGSAKNGSPEDQPIWLTHEDENLNKADVLVVGQGASSDLVGEFDLVCEMLNGHDPEDVQNARQRWKSYKEKEYEISYWQQNDHGGWDQKA